MSYCRWSSDDWKSDIYLYYSVSECWVIHIAKNRIVGDIPSTKEYEFISKEWFQAHHRQSEFLKTCERENIDLVYAGEDFYCQTIDLTIDKIQELIEIGYNVPDYVILNLLEEKAEK